MKKKEPTIILIETSTSLCSAAIASGERIIGYRESDDPRAHASKLAVFIDDMLKEAGITAKECDAVAVSCGPGSYTGLRVGVSTAKGICFGAGIPLISIGTLETLLWQAEPEMTERCSEVIPMIDARRMEVYCCGYTRDGQETMPVQAMILDGESFADRGDDILFIGDGVEKFEEVSPLKGKATFIQCRPKASSMLVPALRKFNAGQFESTAYFEPFYLKEFVATKSKKQILPR